MKTLVKALALVLFSLPLIASAAGKTASSSMQVSFVVKESCAVESTSSSTSNQANLTAGAKAPAVSCQLNTPYQITRGAGQAAVPSSGNTDNSVAVRPAAGAQDWTIYF